MPIAQLDRALDCGSKGRRFESSWARDRRYSRERNIVTERCESGRIGRTRNPLSCFYSSEGSNPSLSVLPGEMTERPKVHAWKACVLYPSTEGSNPSLSVIMPLGDENQALCNRGLPNSVRPGKEQR